MTIKVIVHTHELYGKVTASRKCTVWSGVNRACGAVGNETPAFTRFLRERCLPCPRIGAHVDAPRRGQDVGRSPWRGHLAPLRREAQSRPRFGRLRRGILASP